jgi:hypothetical protein
MFAQSSWINYCEGVFVKNIHKKKKKKVYIYLEDDFEQQYNIRNIYQPTKGPKIVHYSEGKNITNNL